MKYAEIVSLLADVLCLDEDDMQVLSLAGVIYSLQGRIESLEAKFDNLEVL